MLFKAGVKKANRDFIVVCRINVDSMFIVCVILVYHPPLRIEGVFHNIQIFLYFIGKKLSSKRKENARRVKTCFFFSNSAKLILVIAERNELHFHAEVLFAISIGVLIIYRL